MDLDKLQQRAQQYKSLADRQLEDLRWGRSLSDEGRKARMAVIVRRVSGELEALRAEANSEDGQGAHRARTASVG